VFDPNFAILYVQSVETSVAFYERVLGRPPVEASPSYAMFALASGVMLGLWDRAGVVPAAGTGGSSELAIAVPGAAVVDATFREWAAWACRIAQEPTDLDFGRAFLALDPDGHRLRVFAPR
jgi:predicted enzyme related to lactoylglutathione lyase